MNERITIRVEVDIAEGLARFLADDPITCRSRQDAFRHIVRDWLMSRGYIDLPAAKTAASP